jgi:uncharacterized protein
MSRSNHFRFGDLSRLDAVKMPVIPLTPTTSYQSDESILIHLTVTGRCYARCVGCVNAAVTMGSDEPRDSLAPFQDTYPERDAAIIKQLTSRHPEEVITVCFYGGEPFLVLDRMAGVWKILKESQESGRYRFLVYTNGELLMDAIKLYPEFIKDMWVYSVSIDGDEKQHNRVRRGTDLNRVKENLEGLSLCYQGNVLFWSTLREGQSVMNCFEEFMRQYRKGLVNHFFWHWSEEREPIVDFMSFAEQYSQELDEIMRVYAVHLEEGELLPIAHINELVLFLLTARNRGHTACGVEVARNYDIVSGKVSPCADLPSSLAIGELHGKNLHISEQDLKALVKYKEELGCYGCGVHAYCGGRCPVQVMAGSWERTLQYCQLMRLHVGIVLKKMEDISKSLENHGLSLQEVYDRSAFLAKYTDVVP